MPKRLILLGSIAPALLLGGCMGTENRGVESVHQPIVSRQNYALDLATRGDGLAPGERARLAGWMAALHVRYGDHVAVDNGGVPSARIHDQVASVIAGYGLLLDADAPVSTAPLTPATVRVMIGRMTASVPGCPDWSRDESHEFNSNTSSNYGCASNATLAAMVASPEDLVHGRSYDAPIDPATAAKAIDTFRKAEPTGAQGLKVMSVGGH